MSRLSPRVESGIVSHILKGTLNYTQIAKNFGVSTATVSRIAKRHGIGRGAWTEAEDNILREHYETMGARGLEPMLNRTYSAIAWHANKLGLKTRVGPYGKMRKDLDEQA